MDTLYRHASTYCYRSATVLPLRSLISKHCRLHGFGPTSPRLTTVTFTDYCAFASATLHHCHAGSTDTPTVTFGHCHVYNTLYRHAPPPLMPTDTPCHAHHCCHRLQTVLPPRPPPLMLPMDTLLPPRPLLLVIKHEPIPTTPTAQLTDRSYRLLPTTARLPDTLCTLPHHCYAGDDALPLTSSTH
jgi:hypothetical protein